MKEIDPLQTPRAKSWTLYHQAPMPMVTIFKTLDITPLMVLKNKGYKFNMLMCYCIGYVASRQKEFYLLPVGETMMSYERIGINVIIRNQNGELSTCDIPYHDDLQTFEQSYLTLTHKVYQSCEDYEMEDAMIIGTSSLIQYDIDGIVNMYSGIYNNPFLLWGKYRQKEKKFTLRISFQFHHVQMDGLEACQYLESLQDFIFHLKGTKE